MTGRATLGDFLQASRQHLDTLAGSPGRVAGARDVVGVSESLGRLVAVMGRHVEDVTGTHRDLPVSKQPALTPWARAGVEAREALANAARFLPHRTGDRWPAPPAASELGGRLDAAAVSLTAGRDLLQTHFAVSADGTRQHRSEWAMAATSPPATRAMLSEIAAMARQVAPQGR